MKKLVVITGASSGFGKDMAIKFSKLGHPTLLLARRTNMIDQYIKEENLENTIVSKVDVTDYSTFKGAIEEAEKIYGETDLLINNAGVMLLGSVVDQDPKEWKNMLDVNVLGVLNGIQAVLDNMIKKNTGTIINISSIAGRKTFGSHAAYCATKFGVHALTETIREEVSSTNVRVLTIAPGAAETELLGHTTSKEIIDGYNSWKETMGGTSMASEYIADCAVFMYSMPQEVSVREIVIAATKQDS